MDRIASFDDRLFCSVQCFVQRMDCIHCAIRKKIARSLKQKRQPLKALQKRVMQLAGDSCAFRESFLELRIQTISHLSHSITIRHPGQTRGGGHAEKEKPFRLVKRGKDIEVERGSLLVPDVIVVTCDHAEAVVARTEIGIKSLSPGSGFLPNCVAALEFVAKADLLWNYET